MTGELLLGTVILNPIIKLFEIEFFLEVHNFPWNKTSNGKWQFYKLTNTGNEERSIVLLFEDDNLNTINIGAGKKYNFPPFIITEEERKIVNSQLMEFGGEKNYSWGKVELSEDVKGGVLSVLIKYVL